MSTWDAIRAAVETGVRAVADELARSVSPEARLSKSERVFEAAEREAIAIATNPNLWMTGGSQEHVHRPSHMDWHTLKRMSNSPLIAAIHQTRLGQLAEFCRPQDNRYLPGFRVAMRSRRASPTPAALRMMDDIERWIVQCGVVTDTRQLMRRPTFVQFTQAVMRDSLTFDQGCAEIIPTRGSRLARDGARTPGRLQWVDGETIRVSQAAATPQGLPEDDFETPTHVQVIDERVVAEFAPWRLMFGVRNPTTSIDGAGYGVSEQEMLVRILTAWLQVFDRNARYFTQGFNAKGFLNIKGGEGGKVSDSQIQQFRRELMLLASGVTGAHRLPIISSDGIEYIGLGNDVQDAQWGGFSDQQVKIACAIHRMDPTEINHIYGNTGQASSMGSASASERIEESRARGLVPLVSAWFTWLNRWVVYQIDPDFELLPTGTQTRDEKDELDLDAKRVSTIMTVNEARARWDLPPDPHGDVILSPVYIQAMAQAPADGDDGGEAEPLDVGDLFGQEDEASADAGADAGQETGDVVETPQPLQASMAGRWNRVITL